MLAAVCSHLARKGTGSGVRHYPTQRRRHLAAGENGLFKGVFIDAQMLFQDALKDGTQIGRGFKVAIFKQIGLLEARPVGNDAPTFERTAYKNRYRTSTMIGAFTAIDARRATELGDERDHSLAPVVAEIAMRRPDGAIDGREQESERAWGSAFVDVRVPAVECKRANPWRLGTREIFGCGRGSFGKIGAHQLLDRPSLLISAR